MPLLHNFAACEKHRVYNGHKPLFFHPFPDPRRRDKFSFSRNTKSVIQKYCVIMGKNLPNIGKIFHIIGKIILYLDEAPSQRNT
jgi:hypothetical protein